MARATQDRAVVPTVPFGRALAIGIALVGLLAVAVTLAFEHDGVAVIGGALVVGVIWGLGMTAMFSGTRLNAPLLMRIPADALPPRASLPMALVPNVALFAIFAAFALSTPYWLPLSPSGYFLGMVLGSPIAQWASARRSERTERELGGTLWMTPGIAWTRNSRDRYLAVPE